VLIFHWQDSNGIWFLLEDSMVELLRWVELKMYCLGNNLRIEESISGVITVAVMGWTSSVSLAQSPSFTLL
jgi:hypothetical protein